MNWFYESAGQQQGPVSDSALDALLAEGKITPATLVWHDGMTDWKPLRDVRPTGAVPPVPPVGAGAPVSEGQPGPGFVRCSLTGKIIPESEAVYIQGKPYSAEAKPAVLQSVQQSGSVPVLAVDRTGPPWEHRREIGFFTAAWETIKGVLTQPSETFANMKREGGFGTPLLFNVIFGSIGAIAGLVYQLFVNMATGAATATPNPADPTAALTAWMAGSGAIVAFAVLMPLFIAIGSFIWAGITHLSLMICGGAKQPFETTFRVYNYAYGAATFLQVIPLCGALVGGIWGIVVMCIGIAKAHEIGTGRAVLAVLLPMLICCVLVAAIFASIIGVAAAATQGGGIPTVD